MRFERGERALLIGAHEARIPHHIGGEDRGEAPRGAGLFGHLRLRAGAACLRPAELNCAPTRRDPQRDVGARLRDTRPAAITTTRTSLPSVESIDTPTLDRLLANSGHYGR